ncbi:MAG: hypothetical protein RI920_2022 [Pseudomonadota bacterium]|jgi:hypothetical protein
MSSMVMFSPVALGPTPSSHAPAAVGRGVSVRTGALTLSLAALLSALLLSHHRPSLADAVVTPSRAAASTLPIKSDANAAWHQLSGAQRQVLAPLQEHWAGMDDISRDKWLGVAERYPKLSPAEQGRVRERMAQWSKVPAQERGEARLRFQQSRQLTPDERQKKWEAYQALSAEDRTDLQRQGLRRAKPVFLGDNTPGPREAKQAFAIKRNPATTQTDRKSNVVPTPNGNALASASVAPTIVKGGTGATTTLVTQRPLPPLHQQSGLPKITATKGFVDPVTLLPQRGAQGAGMAVAPAPAAGASSAKAAH